VQIENHKKTRSALYFRAGFSVVLKYWELHMVPRPDLKKTKNLLKSNTLKISHLNYAPSYAPNFEDMMPKGFADS
jgi:hypothetical protein